MAVDDTNVIPKRGAWHRRVLLLFATLLLVVTACEGYGLGSGPDRYSEIIKLDLAGGNAQFMDADGAGHFMQMQTHTNWYTGWDHVVLGQVSGDAGTEVVLFDGDIGFLSVNETDNNGVLTQVSVQQNWQTGKTHLVAGDFTGSYRQDLLAVDFAGQSASLQANVGTGYTEQRAYNNWYTGWDDLSPALFSGTEHSDLFFIDYDNGIVSVQQNDGTGLWTQRFYADDWGTNWDDHAIGDFNNDGVDDVLVVDYGGGDAQFWLGNGNGQLILWNSHTNWFTGWDEVVAGDFSGGAADDILLIDNDADFADVLEVNSTGSPVFSGRTNNWGSGYTAAVATGARDADVIGYADPQEFTNEAFHVGRRAVSGTVPTIAILTEKDNGPDSILTQAELFDLMFVGDTSMRGYFLEASQNELSLIAASEIGTAGPFEYTDGLDIWAIRRAIVDQLTTEGWDLAIFDSNGDGQLVDTELLITFLESADPPGFAGGANRTLNPNGSCYQPTGQTVSLCLHIGSTGQQAFTTTLHETAHSYGALDLYVSNGNALLTCRNLGWSLMSCVDEVGHLDPWHELDFGWEQARSYRLNEPGACLDFFTETSLGDNEVIILWDPERGHDEYFIVEYRIDGPNDTIPARNFYDGGFYFWRVQTNAAGNPLAKPAAIGAGPNGVLDTPVAPTDFEQIGTIFEGPDFIMDSVATGDDVVSYAQQVTAIGAAPYSPPGYPGRPFDFFDQEFTLEWSDHTPLGVEFKIGAEGNIEDGKVSIGWYEGAIADAPTTGAKGACFAGLAN